MSSNKFKSFFIFSINITTYISVDTTTVLIKNIIYRINSLVLFVTVINITIFLYFSKIILESTGFTTIFSKTIILFPINILVRRLFIRYNFFLIKIILFSPAKYIYSIIYSFALYLIDFISLIFIVISIERISASGIWVFRNFLLIRLIIYLLFTYIDDFSPNKKKLTIILA